MKVLVDQRQLEPDIVALGGRVDPIVAFACAFGGRRTAPLVQQPRNAPLHDSRFSATSSNRLSSRACGEAFQTGARCMRRSLPFSLSVQAFARRLRRSVPAEPWRVLGAPPSKATVSKELNRPPVPASPMRSPSTSSTSKRGKSQSEQAAPPPYLWRALSAHRREGLGIAALEQLAEERAAANAGNRAFKAKGCRTIDVDAALKSPWRFRRKT